MIEEFLETHYTILAVCGRYGSFPPPMAENYDMAYLRGYMGGLERLIREETRGAKHKGIPGKSFLGTSSD